MVRRSRIDRPLQWGIIALPFSVALLQVRLEFTKAYVNDLEEGSAKLTLADINEEGANLVSLQTRQQLGISALAFAGQSEQSVLSLPIGSNSVRSYLWGGLNSPPPHSFSFPAHQLFAKARSLRQSRFSDRQGRLMPASFAENRAPLAG